MKNKILAFSLMSLAIFSCKKEDSKSEPTRTDLLTQQAWKFDNAGIDANKDGTAETPFPASALPPCLTDNTVTFAKDGNGTVDEGATKCDPADPQTSSFQWNFIDNETAIHITGNAIAGTTGGNFKIVELNDTKFTVSKDTTFQGFSVGVIVSLKH